jgi:tetratricopeptide (TPR) repeat protein
MAETTPNQMRIFVSHSHKDDDACHALVDALRGAGADVWYDEHNMGSGKLMEVIDRELRARPVFLMILSPAALASEWVRDESAWAYRLYKRDPKRIILPVLVEVVNEDEIWLWMQDFRRIETSGVTPFPENERIRLTLRVLTLTPAGEQAVVVTPQPGESLEDLLIQGNALQAQDRHVEALPFFERAALLDPDSFDAWFNLGYTLSQLKRKADALPAYERATTLDPSSGVAWSNKGSVLIYLQRYETGLAACEKALALNPNYALAWNNKGWALDSLKRHDEALAAYDRALTIDPKLILALNNKGRALDELQRHDEALAAYDHVLDPNNANDWNSRAWTLHLLGRDSEALPAVERALTLDPADANALDTKGYALLGLKRFAEAQVWFDQALEIDPSIRESWKGKATALRALGQTAEAEKADQRAKALEDGK